MNLVNEFDVYYIHGFPDDPFRMSGELYMNKEKIADSGDYSSTYTSSIEQWADNIIRTYKLNHYRINRRHQYPEDVLISANDFDLKVEHYQWDCGDGCCSDSGYCGRIEYKGAYFAEWDEWKYNHDRDYMVTQMLERIHERTGLLFDRKDMNIRYVRSEESSDPEEGRVEYED